jgi:predicted nucleic acid-binding protein
MAAPAYLLDTGVALALIRGKALGAKAETELRNAMAELTVIDIHDDDVLRAYAEIYAHLRNHPKGSRTNVGENDMWISAAARASNSTLLTLDRDFDPLESAMITRLYIDPKVKTWT